MNMSNYDYALSNQGIPLNEINMAVKFGETTNQSLDLKKELINYEDDESINTVSKHQLYPKQRTQRNQSFKNTFHFQNNLINDNYLTKEPSQLSMSSNYD